MRIVLALLFFSVCTAFGIAKDQLIEGSIHRYECGDNCYLTIKDASNREHVGLCAAPECRSWNESGEMPKNYIGEKVIVKTGKGVQVNGNGDKVQPFMSFTRITFLHEPAQTTLHEVGPSAQHEFEHQTITTDNDAEKLSCDTIIRDGWNKMPDVADYILAKPGSDKLGFGSECHLGSLVFAQCFVEPRWSVKKAIDVLIQKAATGKKLPDTPVCGA
jgi:hypothetical protein